MIDNFLCFQDVILTLTRQRLSKYLAMANNDEQNALHLYTLNTKISSAFLIDLHYVEIALRNTFDRELTHYFGARWFENKQFLQLLGEKSGELLREAQRHAKRNANKTPFLPGKLIAETTFGFWKNLTDRALEHTLWSRCLYKAFLPRTAPKRSDFYQKLETLCRFRNRIAHHEPILHLNLVSPHTVLCKVADLLCPSTASFMLYNSMTPSLISDCNTYFADSKITHNMQTERHIA